MKIPTCFPNGGWKDIPTGGSKNGDAVVQSLGSGWVSLTHANSPYTPPADLSQTKFYADASGGNITFNAVVFAPQAFLAVKLMSATGAVTVNAPAGWTIEDPNTPGTFAASVNITVFGTMPLWQYDDTNKRLPLL